MKEHAETKAREPILIDLQELFRRAVDHHKCGQLPEAIAAYDRIIALKSDHADAHANRGAALSSLGRREEALTSYDCVIAIRPDDAHAHLSRGDALYNLGRLDEAIAACDRAIALEPGNVEFHDIRGFILRAAGMHAEALVSYDHAIALKPDYAQAHFNRGNVLNDLGRLDDAATSYDCATALKSDYAPAHRNRGYVLHKLGRYDEALASYNRAVAHRSDDAEVHHDRAGVLYQLGRYDEALASYDRAIALKPNYAIAHANRGGALHQLGHFDEALTAFDRAIALIPDYANAHDGRGSVLGDLGRHVEALASYERAVAIAPRHAGAQLNKGILQLKLGNYEDGLETYEWRRRSRQKSRDFTQPQWRGESITEKTILLHAEQGLGDIIQTLRYLPLVKAKAARVILELPKALRPLLGPSANEVEIIEPRSPPPSFDMHCPLMSLPLAFGTRLDTIPAPIPYLTVPAERLPMWQTRLPKSASPRVGLVWSGSSIHKNDRNRSIALDRLAPLLNVTGVSVVSLQREYRERDIPALARLPIERIDDAIRDFGDTAAAIEQCDLVISVDTAVAHLAGSLGKPLWLLLPYDPDWRWLLDRTDSPWYPTARLFRQTRIGDWESVITAVANELSMFSEGF